MAEMSARASFFMFGFPECLTRSTGCAESDGADCADVQCPGNGFSSGAGQKVSAARSGVTNPSGRRLCRTKQENQTNDVVLFRIEN